MLRPTMGKAYISKTVKFTPELYAKIEAAMHGEGAEDFSEFARRAVTAELRLAQMRQDNITQMGNNSAKPAKGSTDPEAHAIVLRAIAELQRLDDAEKQQRA